MSNMYINNLILKMDGTSHSDEMTLTVNNFPKGIIIDKEQIKKDLAKRRPNQAYSNARIEEDDYNFISGVKDGYTNGETLIIKVKNSSFNRDNYTKGVIRPSHADYPAYIKYGDNYDYAGGGQFSGRLMVLIVIFGVLCKTALKKHGVKIASHIKNIMGITDSDIDCSDNEIEYLDSQLMLSEYSLDKINAIIRQKKLEGDSLGGTIEAYATGVKVGLGEDYFGGLESRIASLMYSIPAVKAVEFGEGVNFANLTGYVANDPIQYVDGRVKIMTNHAGGINGGLSNGNPIVCKVTFRPTSSISKKQESINIETKENIDLEINGNHDCCIALRSKVIVEGMMAIALLDSYLEQSHNF